MLEIGVQELRIYRRLLLSAAAIYLAWWFAVDFILPQAQNPFTARAWVIAYLSIAYAMSYRSEFARRHIRLLFLIGAWALTLHYYYLFYLNISDLNCIVGAYITIIAINLCIFTNRALISYSAFVTVLSVILTLLDPRLQRSVFLPGVITIIVQANIGMRSRLNLIQVLELSNERFQLLFNSTFEGILVYQELTIINVNASLARMLGYSRQELIGSEIWNIVPPELRESLRLRLQSGENELPFETCGYTKDRKSVEVEIRAKVFMYNRTPARLLTVQDIRDRKRAESERISALAFQQNVKARDEFISIASHELKTPISSLKLQTQIIERDLKKSEAQTYPVEKIRAFIEVFHRQTNRLTELVETMLDVSRISVGQLKLDLQISDLVKLVREVVAGLPLLPGTSTSDIEMQLPPSLVIRMDPSRVYQVVENLLTNAIKYGNGKNVVIRLSSTSTAAIIEIEDHGIGIAAESVDRVFGRFERAVSAQNISGLGLGLYIAKKIVEAHGGSIRVKSQLGQGSTFTVSLLT
jgi:PAS domain S-box-containing protein